MPRTVKVEKKEYERKVKFKSVDNDQQSSTLDPPSGWIRCGEKEILNLTIEKRQVKDEMSEQSQENYSLFGVSHVIKRRRRFSTNSNRSKTFINNRKRKLISSIESLRIENKPQSQFLISQTSLRSEWNKHERCRSVPSDPQSSSLFVGVSVDKKKPPNNVFSALSLTLGTDEVDRSRTKKRKQSPPGSLRRKHTKRCQEFVLGQEREIEISPKKGILLDADAVEDINAANLIVRNLDKIVDDGQLFRFFSLFGEIVSHKVATNEQGQSIGFGYVRYKLVKDMEAAVAATNDVVWFGRNIKVEKFFSKCERFRKSEKSQQIKKISFRPRIEPTRNSRIIKRVYHNVEDLFPCSENVASFIKHKYSDRYPVRFHSCDDGIKVKGDEKEVIEVMSLLRSKTIECKEAEFILPNLSKYLQGTEFCEFVKRLEKRFSCFIHFSSTECKPLIPIPVQIEVVENLIDSDFIIKPNQDVDSLFLTNFVPHNAFKPTYCNANVIQDETISAVYSHTDSRDQNPQNSLDQNPQISTTYSINQNSQTSTTYSMDQNPETLVTDSMAQNSQMSTTDLINQNPSMLTTDSMDQNSQTLITDLMDQNLHTSTTYLMDQNPSMSSTDSMDQKPPTSVIDSMDQNLQISTTYSMNQNPQTLITDLIDQNPPTSVTDSMDQNAQTSTTDSMDQNPQTSITCLMDQNAQTLITDSMDQNAQTSIIDAMDQNPQISNVNKQIEHSQILMEYGIISAGLIEDNLHKILDSALIATTQDETQQSGKRPNQMNYKIISFASSEQLVQQLSAELDQLKASEVSSVALDSFDIKRNGISIRTVANSLRKALARFQASQLDPFGLHSQSKIQFIQIVIRKPELVPIFKKFAIPEKASLRRLGKNPDRGVVTVVSSNPTSMKRVIQEVQQYKEKHFHTSVCVDDQLCEFENNEIEEINKLASSKSVCCLLQKNKSLCLYGLKKNVKLVSSKIKKMNKSFKLAKLVAKTCCWKWEVNPGHFAVLPMRVASKLEKSPRSYQSFRVRVCGEKVMMNTANMTFETTNGKVGRIVREDVVKFSQQSATDELQQLKFCNVVMQKPDIDVMKLKYIESLLCGDLKGRGIRKLNKLFDQNKLRARFAVINNDVTVVTNSTDTFKQACYLLEKEIHCAQEKAPASDHQSGPNEVLLKSKLLELNMKWLRFYFESGDVVVSSFCKDDVTKSLNLIKDLAETFLTTELFRCGTEVASYILKVYSKTMCDLFWEKVDDGVKIKGPAVKVVTAKVELEKMKVTSSDVEFVAPALDHFTSEWRKKLDEVEANSFCSLSFTKVEKKDDQADLNGSSLIFEVCQGDIADQRTDAIINGVGDEFDLHWGKISPAILSKAGNDIDAACLNNPLVSTEHIRVTPAGNLQCKYIFHIITPSSCKELTERIELVLKEAEKMGMTSISLPTLGAGGIGLDACDVAEALKEAFLDFIADRQTKTSIELVRVVVFDSSITDVFKLIVTSLNNLKPNRDLGSKQEKWVVKITSDHVNLTRAKATTLRVYENFIHKIKEEDERISDLEEHDIMALDEYARACHVSCQLVFSGTPNIMISGMKHQVEKMLEHVQVIMDEIAEASVVATSGRWMWKAYHLEKYTPLPLRVSRRMMSCYKKSKQSSFSIQVCGKDVLINFSKKTYQFGNLSESGSICFKNKVEKVEKLPSSWEPMNNENFKLCVLSTSSPKYSEVKQQFLKSNPRHSAIISIKRVQNPSLYHHYRIEKENVARRATGSNPVKRYLFHGTCLEDAEKICKYGFNRSFAGKNATAYGKGTYFACNSSYSVDYTNQDSNGHRHMILAYVLTGNFCQGSSSILTAPQHTDGNLYDSVTNNMHSPSMFVVFKDASAYPAYLITFR